MLSHVLMLLVMVTKVYACDIFFSKPALCNPPSQTRIPTTLQQFDGRPVAASFVDEEVFTDLYDAILREDAAVKGLAAI